ncbi:hypothetical protein MRX96_014253 [Rhipicephalus microplus]
MGPGGVGLGFQCGGHPAGFAGIGLDGPGRPNNAECGCHGTIRAHAKASQPSWLSLAQAWIAELEQRWLATAWAQRG